MTKLEKQNYLNKNTVGYWCDLMGIELKDIEYIRICGRRFYFDECFRTY